MLKVVDPEDYILQSLGSFPRPPSKLPNNTPVASNFSETFDIEHLCLHVQVLSSKWM